jgi:hypothetical protein
MRVCYSLQKQRKKTIQKQILLYIENTYTLLNVVSAGIEVFVISGNKFLYACVKEACRLWSQPRFDTFHQLVIIAEALWSQSVLQVGKQVLVSWKEISV